MAWTTEDRQGLLDVLVLDHGHAGDSAFSERSFYPVREHLRALEPEVIFVVGARGVGKSMLVRAIRSSPTNSAALLERAKVDVPAGGVAWLGGHPYAKLGPTHRAWESFLLQTGGQRDRAQLLWLAMLVRTLRDELTEPERAALAPVLEAQGADAEALYSATCSIVGKVELALDALDERLVARDRFLFVTYDELDTLYYERWGEMLRCLAGLTSLWAGYFRRWNRLRPKFFVRTDLFAEQATRMSSDAAKMAARRVELSWSSRHLYGALFKQITARHPQLHAYFARTLRFRESMAFGDIPVFDDDDDVVPAVSRLCGKWMGANEQKGLTHRWLIRAISDGHGDASPRNLIRLVEIAAAKERIAPRPVNRAKQLLHHVTLRNALEEVSKDHVTQAMQHEHPWLSGVRKRLEPVGTREVPWDDRRALERALGRDWDSPWSDAGGQVGDDEQAVRPPASDAPELVDRLLRLGILRERRGNAIDVPDLYLDGLHLRRKGGVARDV